jgi:LysM repeat protein
LSLAAGLALAAALPAALPAGAFGVAPREAATTTRLYAEGETTYTVQPGDSLYRIANRFGVSLDALIAANHLTTTVIQPGQVLIIPGVAPQPEAAQPEAPPPAPDSIYNRIRGSVSFVQRITEALDWMQAHDPDAYNRVDTYVTVIQPSTFARLAIARPLPGGQCRVLALARRGMEPPLTAALLFHEASHCYQFATAGLLPTKDAEVFAYSEQIAFMERNGFAQEDIDFYRRVLEYYQSQPDDGRYIPPPNF